MRFPYKLLLITFILFLKGNSVFAKDCDIQGLNNLEVGKTIHLKVKAKVNTICSVFVSVKKTSACLGLQMIKYPKKIINFLDRCNEVVYAANKVGEYKISFRVLVNQSGKQGYINYVANLKVVESSF